MIKSFSGLCGYILLIVLFCNTFCSCYTYKIYPKTDRHFSYAGNRSLAYVTNPSLKKEYAILHAAGIFELTTDSLDSRAIKIQLLPLKKGFTCGQPAVLSLFTLGQLPVIMPDSYTFIFQEIYPADSQYRSFQLHVATRIWFWDLFAFNKNFNGKAGQTLSAQYFHGQPANAAMHR